ITERDVRGDSSCPQMDNLSQLLPPFTALRTVARGQMLEAAPRVEVWRENAAASKQAEGTENTTGHRRGSSRIVVSDEEDELEMQVCTEDSVLNFMARGSNCIVTVLLNQKTSVGRCLRFDHFENNFKLYQLEVPSGNPR
ncbi:unnamed protein product, partial [Amoebophrya sp. A25]